MRKTLIFCLLFFLSFFLSSCAKNTGAVSDPYEKINRFSFALNQDLDHLIFRPVAEVYTVVTPPPLRKGITNVFDNIQEITTIPNDLLQGKIRYFFIDIWRLLINSTIGVGGLFDVATRMGLPRHYEDFGLTLATWSGGRQSPYFVIPIFGPSTFRDGYGRLFDLAASPYPYIQPDALGWAAFGLKLINIRSELLPANKLIDTAFDPYVFVRDAYLQHREQMVANNERPFQPTLKHGIPVTRQELRGN